MRIYNFEEYFVEDERVLDFLLQMNIDLIVNQALEYLAANDYQELRDCIKENANMFSDSYSEMVAYAIADKAMSCWLANVGQGITPPITFKNTEDQEYFESGELGDWLSDCVKQGFSNEELEEYGHSCYNFYQETIKS